MNMSLMMARARMNHQPAAGGKTWWRIKITAVQSGMIAALVEVIMRSTSGGANRCTGGTAFADSSYSTSYAAINAFDGNTGDGVGSPPFPWASANLALPHFIGYRMPSSVEVVEVTIYPRYFGNVYQSPQDFVIQSSIDSTNGSDGTWVDEWSITGQSSWASLTPLTFTKP